MSKGRVVPNQGELWVVKKDSARTMVVLVAGKVGLLSTRVEYSEGNENTPRKVDFDWLSSGLRKKSHINLSKWYVPELGDFVRKLGRLSSSDRNRIIGECRSALFAGNHSRT